MNTVRKIERAAQKRQKAVTAQVPAEVIKAAKIEGVKAFQTGGKMPAAFSEYACRSEYDTAALLSAFWNGYTVASLAECALDETFPSVKSLNELMK